MGGIIEQRPTRSTVGGRAYLDLQRQAKTDRRITSEYLKLYALEGFLLRLANSDRRNRFVLKGGVLLAAYELRRRTADIDFAALQTTNDVETIRQDVIAIASTHLPLDLDDGLIFDPGDVTALVIRDQDQYSGVRVRMAVALATARERFHIDVNVGDPIWPAPSEIQLPRLLPDQASIALRGYPMEMVLAEKTVTALQLGIASTRWRDFGDIYSSPASTRSMRQPSAGPLRSSPSTARSSSPPSQVSSMDTPHWRKVGGSHGEPGTI